MPDGFGGLWRFLQGDEGATAVEYGLMLALIAAVIIGSVELLGDKTADAYTDMNTKWP